jgi:D-ribulokinase
MPYYLGIDIGTSGIRIIVINQLQEIVTQVQQTFAQYNKNNRTIDKEKLSENNPQLWWKIVRELFSTLQDKIDLQQVLAIAVDATSGTVLATDKTGKPLHHALMYHDQRALSQSNKINFFCPSASNRFSANSGLAKMLWLWEHLEKDNIQYFLNQADWIVGKLTGQFAFSDLNNVLKMGYDTQNKQWPEWFRHLDLPLETLPKVLEPGKFIHHINADMYQFGFTQQVLIISGTTDSTAAVMASGASQIGESITSLGSTLVTKIISDTFIEDSTTGVYSQPYGKYWLVGGSSNCGGEVLRQYFSPQQIKQLSQQIDFSRPTGLNYYPLTQIGERFPIADMNKKPLLSPRPKNDTHFFQAILEGITTIEKQAYNTLNSLGCPKPIKNYSMGGGTKNTRWMQYRQHQLAFPVILPANQDAAYGTAKLAILGYKNDI